MALEKECLAARLTVAVTEACPCQQDKWHSSYLAIFLMPERQRHRWCPSNATHHQPPCVSAYYQEASVGVGGCRCMLLHMSCLGSMQICKHTICTLALLHPVKLRHDLCFCCLDVHELWRVSSCLENHISCTCVCDLIITQVPQEENM